MKKVWIYSLFVPFAVPGCTLLNVDAVIDAAAVTSLMAGVVSILQSLGILA